ncbi:MAG TPA: NAD-dependent epimerase/dehydratase family protein [Thermoplasmata archaeon]|nr:NAD-dependent epimerase/dehydratase family protein [Thermoplasmata archaeon]
MAGASGFLGTSVVRAFAGAGYGVRGLVRDEAKRGIVESAGGTAVVGNVLEPGSLERALPGVTGIIHLAANPAAGEDPRRVRVEGIHNLMAAARKGKVRRVVIGSGYWVYRGQEQPLNEESPLDPQGESRINFETERTGLERGVPAGPEVLVARPGMVYGNGSWFRGMAEQILSREYRVVGDGANRWSFVERWDAGTAFRTIFERGSPRHIYNVVDGHPGAVRGFADFVADQLRVLRPPIVPIPVAARTMGEVVARHLAADRPTSNQRLTALGWHPRFPEYRAGVPGLLEEMFPHRSG